MIRTCPDCGKGFETFHDPPADKCADCRVEWHSCATCGNQFGLDPMGAGIELFGPNCLGDDCPSYDIDRDPTWMFSND